MTFPPTDFPHYNSQSDAAIGRQSDPEAAAGDGSVIAILKRQRTLLGTIAVLAGAGIGFTFIGTRLATDATTAKATAAAPTYAEGSVDYLSVDLAGSLRTSGSGGGNPSGGFLDSIKVVRQTDTLRDGRLDSVSQVTKVDSIRKVLAIDSLRKVVILDSVRKVQSVISLDSLRKLVAVDSVRKVQSVDSLRLVRFSRDSILTWLGSAAPTVGQKTMASSLPVVVASDQSNVNVVCVSGCAGATEGQTYSAAVFSSAAAANKDHLNLFNASGSGVVVRIRSITVAPQLAAAITGLLQTFLVQKTSTAGATCTAVTIRLWDNTNAAVPAQVTSTANCTTDPTNTFDWLVCDQDGEDARSGNTLYGNCYLHPANGGQPFVLRVGEGISVRSGALSGAWPVSVQIMFTMGST